LGPLHGLFDASVPNVIRQEIVGDFEVGQGKAGCHAPNSIACFAIVPELKETGLDLQGIPWIERVKRGSMSGSKGHEEPYHLLLGIARHVRRRSDWVAVVEDGQLRLQIPSIVRAKPVADLKVPEGNPRPLSPNPIDEAMEEGPLLKAVLNLCSGV
jgi:hypothetical protein